MNKYYVAYGSNLNLENMAYRCPTAKIVGKGMIRDYRLAFRGTATILKKKGAAVPVAVWEIDENCEKALDRYEGWPNFYRKEDIEVEMYDGKKITGMVYIMNHGRIDVPIYFYFETIQTGYEEIGLDMKYLDEAIDEVWRKKEKTDGPQMAY